MTLGITCQKMLRGLGRLWQYVIIPGRLRAGIDRERRRASAGRRDRLPDDAGLADYEYGWGRRCWTREDRCLSSPPGPKVPPVVPSGLRAAPVAAGSRSPRTTTAGERKP